MSSASGLGTSTTSSTTTEMWNQMSGACFVMPSSPRRRIPLASASGQAVWSDGKIDKSARPGCIAICTETPALRLRSSPAASVCIRRRSLSATPAPAALDRRGAERPS